MKIEGDVRVSRGPLNAQLFAEWLAGQQAEGPLESVVMSFEPVPDAELAAEVMAAIVRRGSLR